MAEHARHMAAPEYAPSSLGPWFWLRYPLFAIIAATLLEVGTLAGAPLSSPFVSGDWSLARWLVFFCAMLLVAIPIFGTLDRGGGARIVAWAREAHGRHVRQVAITFAVALAVAVAAGFLFAAFGPPHAPGDARLAAIFGLVCGATTIGAMRYRLMSRQVEWAFLLIVLTAGIALQVALPPYTNLIADDRAHLQAALGISYVVDGQFSEAQAAAAEVAIDDAPWDDELVDSTPMEEALSELFSWDGYCEDVEAINAQTPAEDYIRVTGFSNVRGDSYLSMNFVGRIPLAMGLWTGRLLGLPPSGQIIAGRTANLLFFALVTFVALRTLRSGRPILLLVALLPPIVMLASNFNYDAWMISLIFLGVSRFARIVQEREAFTANSALRVLVPLLLGVMVKATYFPLLILPLFAPAACFGASLSRRALIVAYGGVICVLLLAILVPLVLTRGESNTDTSLFSDTSIYGQVGYILSAPLHFARNMVVWGAGFFNPANVAQGLFDNFLIHELSEATIYAENGGPLAWLSSGLVFLGPLALRDAGDRAYRTPPMVMGTLILCLLAFWFMAGALYLAYTPVGADTIIGVQYRYLFPLLFPFALFVENPPVRIKARWDVVNGVLVCVLALLLFVQLGWAVFSWI